MIIIIILFYNHLCFHLQDLAVPSDCNLWLEQKALPPFSFLPWLACDEHSSLLAVWLARAIRLIKSNETRPRAPLNTLSSWARLMELLWLGEMDSWYSAIKRQRSRDDEEDGGTEKMT